MRAPSRHVHAADGTRIAFRENGAGPAVVLANGLSTSDFFWRILEPRWAAGHRVIGHAVDGLLADVWGQ